jgi:hypothetical protein
MPSAASLLKQSVIAQRSEIARRSSNNNNSSNKMVFQERGPLLLVNVMN